MHKVLGKVNTLCENQNERQCEMKHYENLLEKGNFTREQLIEIVGTAGAANSIIYDYQTKRLI